MTSFLKLEKIIPLPLKEKIIKNKSEVWMQSLVLEKGKYYFIQAASGTGKTTLIHFLSGLRTDYEGAIIWGDQLLRAIDVEELAKMRTNTFSVIFQDMRLFPELSVAENIEIKRCLTNHIEQKEVQEWMNKLAIGDKQNALAKKLSYGEQQRVAIIRALVQPFDFLLMDEPFSHLDKKNIERASTLILEIVERNKAGFLLSDLDENSYFPYHKTLML